MSHGCCGGGAVRLVGVGDTEVGLAGVDVILELFYVEGWSPGEAGLKDALLEALQTAGNYIPPGQEAAYAAALTELFRRYCAARTAVLREIREETQ